MSTRPAIRRMMTQSVEVEAFLSRDAYGTPSYASMLTAPARVEYRTRVIRARDGREVVARATVYLPHSVTVGGDDRLTLPDGSTATPLDVRPVTDLDGSLHHVEVLV